jgi:uncharacterized protein (TIGR01319 family)
MILIAGGTDGGTVRHVVKIGEVIASAEPKSRLGFGYKLPIVFAGNKNAVLPIKELFYDKYALEIVNNLRPRLEEEDVAPARAAIHHLFMEHAPGYDKLMTWTDIPIIPTPAGEGMMFNTIANATKTNVIGVGLGGATTNVYSIYNGRFVRTVSANLGMSYSICNVLKETGIENIVRWLPFEIDSSSVRNILRNKMIRPTTIPQTLKSLLIEHSVAREALRLGFLHHKYLARPLRGIQRRREMADLFDQKTFEESYIDMKNVEWVSGTGGLLSHAPRRAQAALMMIDGFQPEGITKLAVDSIFMMPHLGVLSTVHPKAAMEIFEKDCLVRIGTVIAPKNNSDTIRASENVLSYTIELPTGESLEKNIEFGKLEHVPLSAEESVKISLKPNRNFDVGAGFGNQLETLVDGGVVGLIFDTRGRPLNIPNNILERKKKLIDWFKALDVYPNEIYDYK